MTGPSDERVRCAVAILLFVDAASPLRPGEPPHDLAGAKHFVLVFGHDAETVFSKARTIAQDIEGQLTEMATSEIVLEVMRDTDPYVATKFLGLQDLRWADEQVGEGAVLYVGPEGAEGLEAMAQFEVERRKWICAGSWCLAEVLAELTSLDEGGTRTVNECFVVFRAEGPVDAVQKARLLVGDRSVLCGKRFRFLRFNDISMIDDSDLDDGAEMLYFTAVQSASRWRHLVREREDLSVFRSE